MNILVTGVTRLKELQQLDGIGVDLAGFPLGGAELHTLVPEAEDLRDSDFELRKTGVFEKADHAAILEAVDSLGLEVVVLYDDADAELCSDLSSEVEVVKAIRIDGLGEKDISSRIAPFDDTCDYYLFASEQKNWSVLSKVKIEKPFFIGGKIGVADLAGLVKFKHPDLYGIVVSLGDMGSASTSAMAGVLQLKKSVGA